MKKIVLINAVSVLLLGSSAVYVSAGDKCTELLTTTCNVCHSRSNFCKNLGKSQDFWKETLNTMIDNGASLSDGEKKELIECLSKPTSSAELACKKK